MPERPANPPLSVVLLDSIPTWGGGEKWCIDAATALRERGHRVAIAAAEGSALLERSRKCGVETWALDVRGWRAIPAGFALARRMRSARADVLVANVGRDVRVGAIACSRSDARLVQRRGIARELKRDPLNRWIYRRCVRRVIVNCAAIRDEMLGSGGVIGPERFAVVANGIEVPSGGDGERWRREHGIAPHAPLAIVVGRLAPMKGHEHLLRAWERVVERVPDARLVVAGDGELAAELAARARELRSKGSILFTGFVRELADLYAAADLFVLPSVRDEGCNNALLEAMARGLAAVVTRCGGLPESTVDGVTGRVVAIGDSDALASAIADLLADPATRRSMGQAAKRRAAEHYSRARVTDELERVLREVRDES